mgnify:CR=1 FL=1
MIRNAHAKINLSINVLGRRADGYHELDMINLPLELADRLEMDVDEEMSYQDNCQLPFDEHNIIYKAIGLLREEFGFKENFRIRLDKRIPMMAGLGGGSADGAAALHLVNDLLDLGLTDDQLALRGRKLGADVPFCIYNQPARVRGIGEELEMIPVPQQYEILLVKPKGGVSTAEAYRMCDENGPVHPDIDKIHKALIHDEPLKGLLGNSLLASALTLEPRIGDILAELRPGDDGEVMMSGSGSACFLISHESHDELYENLQNRYDFVGKTRTLNSNVVKY